MTPPIQLTAPIDDREAAVLTPAALSFVATLQEKFGAVREQLLAARHARQRDQFDAGGLPDFLAGAAAVRDGSWKVAPAPADLERRWVEITGPVERKMMINALASGADVFMADFEDSLSPTWRNVAQGQVNLADAVRRTIAFTSPEGKEYRLPEKTATLLVRPRGWHLVEKHALSGGVPVSASLFDFGVYFFHNARALLERKSGPYFYLPKMESHLEARLWNDVFNTASDAVGVPRGTIRATVLIETLPAAFEIGDILYELRDHASGCNAGRWDYLFSVIKKFRKRSDLVLPDRAQLTMTVPFMRAYAELLVKTCHAHGAHAMGGMAPFIPSRREPEINAAALEKVRADKEREVDQGFDGTWVAHPDLVTVARDVFARRLGDKPHQKDRLRPEVVVTAGDLSNTRIEGGTVTEAGVRNNINVGLQYLHAWLAGSGAVGIHNLMEDVATAEIARAQIWQWMRRGAKLDDGRTVTRELYERLRDEEVSKLGPALEPNGARTVTLLDGLVEGEAFAEFLTLEAYAHLE
ncbi:MAG TPA: malate synthase A [Polyangiaceae bacterium]|jgi:malate synthase